MLELLSGNQGEDKPFVTPLREIKGRKQRGPEVREQRMIREHQVEVHLIVSTGPLRLFWLQGVSKLRMFKDTVQC